MHLDKDTVRVIDVDDNGTRGWRDEEVGGRMGAYMLFTWPLDISYVSPAEAARKITFQA